MELAEFGWLEHACRCSGQLCGGLRGSQELYMTINFEHRKKQHETSHFQLLEDSEKINLTTIADIFKS